MFKQKKISAIIPARDEEHSIAKVITELFSLHCLDGSRLFDHIVVCDNGSTDNTAYVATQAGAIVVLEKTPGYGIACLTALATMPQSDIVVFIDGDFSFYAKQCLPMLNALDGGSDLVIGSRTLGNIQPGALTFPQRCGNWLASRMIRLLWRHPVTDLGPFRAISATALQQLNMQDTAFGWTVEMQVKAIQHNMKITEAPVDTRPRIGVSKISGTIRGVIGAALGIFGTIFKLWYSSRFLKKNNAQRKANIS